MALHPDSPAVADSPENDRQEAYTQAGVALEQIMQLGFGSLETHVAMSDTLDDALDRSRRYQRLADFLREQAGLLDSAASTVRHAIARTSENAEADVAERQNLKSPGGIISAYPDVAEARTEGRIR